MNTPNKITLARICLIPLVIFFYLASFIPWGKFIAGAIFVIACLTDFVDGYLARKNNQVTTLGKFLDPIADKILIMSALILIISTPIINGSAIIRPQWLGIVCGIIILSREFAVSTLRQVAATKGVVLAADKSGKYKAAMQDVTLALYFFFAFFVVEFYNGANASLIQANSIIAIVLLVFLCITTILTVSSGIEYFYKNWHIFSEKKVGQEENMVLFVENAEEVKSLENQQESFQESTQEKTQIKDKTTSKKNLTQNSTNLEDKNNSSKANDEDKNGRVYDELIPIALDLFCQKGWASTTMLQKYLGVGYPRASKIVDQMEELGLVSSNRGAKTREVLVSKEEFEKNNKIFK